jgi:hypothetical protein
MKKNTPEQKMLYVTTLLFAVFFLLPFILFGTNSIVTIHDYLDFYIPKYKMYKENGLFFKFDTPTKGFSEMSTLYYARINFSLTPLLYYFFNDFVASIINNYFYIFFGFFSMYLFLKKIGEIDTIIIYLLSLCYAILPVCFDLGICVSTLPLIIVAFPYFISQNKFSWKILFLLFYPFFSYFSGVGIFVLGFWFLGLIVLGIKNKKINLNLLIGFILLCIGYILVDLRLFYVMFVLKTPLNRSIFYLSKQVDSGEMIKVLLNSLRNYFLHGHYHVTSFQRKIIVPLAFLVSVFCIIKLIRRIIRQSGTMFARIKTAVGKSGFHEKLLFILEFTVFIFSFIAALYQSRLLNRFIVKYIPILSGFNWGRVWIFNRVLWYVIFALCLQFILEINFLLVLKIKINKIFWKIKSCSFIPRLCAYTLIGFQILYISLTPVTYSDQLRTWFNEIAIKTGVAKMIIPNNVNFDAFISYREFFAKNLFERIKKDISYSDEKVVAFGYHPSVLMYNGFNCIDGYNNAYPLSYMWRFRTLIAPELEINQSFREYYDNGGIRMYLYNSELSYQPTRDKNTLPVKLNIDMDVFKNDFQGKYILSRAEISNCDTLGLKLIKRYYDEESIYTIYLYKTM